MFRTVSRKLANYYRHSLYSIRSISICNQKPPPPKKEEEKCAKSKSEECPFRDKVALVTGGASGIGFQCCKALLRNGCRGVTIADRDAKSGAIALKNLASEFGGDRAVFIECDVRKSELVDWAFKTTVNAFNRIDIVINNAGVIKEKYWEDEILTNINGTLTGCMLGFQYMSAHCVGNGGYVVNIASTMGLTSFSGCPLYTMTQSGIIGLSRALGASKHVKTSNVKVMALCIGLTDTPLLHNVLRGQIQDRYGGELRNELEYHKWQKPERVSEAVIKAILDGESGSLWVVECGTEPHKICIPCYEMFEDKGGDTVCVCDTPCPTKTPNVAPVVVVPPPPKAAPKKVEKKDVKHDAKKNEKDSKKVEKAAAGKGGKAPKTLDAGKKVDVKIVTAKKAASDAKKTDPKKAIAKKVEAKKAESKKTESKKTETKKTETKKAEPKKAEPKKTDPKKVECKKLDLKKIDLKKAASGKDLKDKKTVPPAKKNKTKEMLVLNPPSVQPTKAQISAK